MADEMGTTDFNREEVGADIADTVGRDHCILTGRATTGLYLLFEALSIKGEVIFPAYTCPSPVYAARYAGATPIFCDVAEQDYTLDVDRLEQQLSEETEVIVAINMFGHPARYDEIRDLCANRDILLVEDACQSVGTTYGGMQAGQFGDVSLLSFGSKKPLDAGGGGAVLTDDSDIAEAVATLESDIPVRDDGRLEKLHEHYRNLYYSIEDLTELTDRAHKLFGTLPKVFRELYVCGFDDALLTTIDSALTEREAVIETRRRHAELYRTTMTHDRLTHPDPAGNPVHYRYSVTLDSEALRDHVVSSLRDSDIHVSTLYDPIHQRFGDMTTYETAESLSRRTINVWVSREVDEAYVRRTAEAVVDSIKEYTYE